MNIFRPCIDLVNGNPKRLEGGNIQHGDDGKVIEKVGSYPRPAWYYVSRYQEYQLYGGHICMLSRGEAREMFDRPVALEALRLWRGGMQIAGGINPTNAREYLNAGAAKVVVTSFVFSGGEINFKNLEELLRVVNPEELVLDLSSRPINGKYIVHTDSWQKPTTEEIREAMRILSPFCSEFLVHAVNKDGTCTGIDKDLIRILADYSPIPVVYASGANSLDDLDYVAEVGKGRMGLTIGKALDMFGGHLRYKDVVRRGRELAEKYKQN